MTREIFDKARVIDDRIIYTEYQLRTVEKLRGYYADAQTITDKQPKTEIVITGERIEVPMTVAASALEAMSDGLKVELSLLQHEFEEL